MNKPLTVNGLTVKRSDQFTLRLDSLECPAGQIVCITGPNGSGKTTLLECVAGLLSPDGGSVHIMGTLVGSNIAATRTSLGYIPDDEHWFIQELCAQEYFLLLEGMYKKAGVRTDMKQRVSVLASTIHFSAFTQRLASLSHGNKKKVQIIAGLMHQPALLVIDELRNGLDPLAIIAAEQLIRRETARGLGILAATHDLWWAERLASDIVMLVDGKISVRGKARSLVKKHGSLENLFIKIMEGRGDV